MTKHDLDVPEAATERPGPARGERVAPISAAVLVPLFRDERDELRLVLVARSPRGLHGGQISFPGGKRERKDTTLLETAWKPASAEIAAVLTLDCATLADPWLRDEAVLSFPAWPESRQVDRIRLDDEHAIWGFTLRLLDAVVPRLLAEEWEI
jgi:8-oxo-dGTP pyrophosphatase MutT (NUDIX family)